MSYRDYLMRGVAFAPDGADGGGAGPSGGDFGGTIATLPENIRGHEALKGVKDIGGLVKGLVTIATPKPPPAPRDALLAALPEDLRGEAYWKDVADIPTALKRAHDQARLIGVDKAQLLRIPSSADDKEGWAQLNKALGVPETADKYVVPKRGDGAEYSEGDKKFQGKVLPILHEAGVPQSAIDKIIPKWNEMSAALQAEADTTSKAADVQNVEKFKAELGAAFQPTLDLASETLAYYAKQAGVGKEVIADLEKDGLGNRPGFTKILAFMGKQLREDGLIGKGGDGAAGAFAPAEAQQKIAAKHGDKDFMKRYRNKREAGHKEAVAEMEGLYSQAYPTAEK